MYVNRYPTGKFSSEAMKRLSSLQAASAERTAAESAKAEAANAEAARKAAAERAAIEAAQRAAAELAKAEATKKSAADRATAEAAQKAAAERASAEGARKAQAERELAHAKEQADLQEAIDNRTAELLASLANPPRPSAASSPATSQKPARPVAASNALGFTVGDRWRYQIVDKWKNEVIRNASFKVDRIRENGDMEWNDSSIITGPDGSRRYANVGSGRANEYSPQLEWLPKELRIGYKQDVNYIFTRTQDGAVDYRETYKGAMLVKGKEKVTVPAGEFEAYRIEREYQFTGTPNSGARGWYGLSTAIYWYVPALRNYVAFEIDHRSNGVLVTRERHELTSFSVRGAENLAQR